MKRRKTGWVSLAAAVLICGTITTGGCDSDAKTGTLIGAGLGAALGAGLDHKNRGRGALIGAGVGGAGGYMVGNESDKKKSGNY